MQVASLVHTYQNVISTLDKYITVAKLSCSFYQVSLSRHYITSTVREFFRLLVLVETTAYHCHQGPPGEPCQGLLTIGYHGLGYFKQGYVYFWTAVGNKDPAT
jgi:hypothetical protein